MSVFFPMLVLATLVGWVLVHVVATRLTEDRSPRPAFLPPSWQDGPRYHAGRLVEVHRHAKRGDEGAFLRFRIELDPRRPLPNLTLDRDALDVEDVDRASLLSDPVVREAVAALPDAPELRGNALWLDVRSWGAGPEQVDETGLTLAVLARHLEVQAPKEPEVRLRQRVETPGPEADRLTCLSVLHRFGPDHPETTRATGFCLRSSNPRLVIAAASLVADQEDALPEVRKLSAPDVPVEAQVAYWSFLADHLDAGELSDALRTALADTAWSPPSIVHRLIQTRLGDDQRDELAVALLGHPRLESSLKETVFASASERLAPERVNEVALRLLASPTGPTQAAFDFILAHGSPADRNAALALALRNSKLRVAAADTIGMNGLTSFAGELASRLTVSRGTSEAVALSEALGRLGDPIAEGALLEEVDSRDVERQVAACEALGKLGTPAALGPLTGLSEGTVDYAVRQAARGALLDLRRYRAAAAERLAAATGPGPLRALVDDVRAPLAVRRDALLALQSGPAALTLDELRRLLAQPSVAARRLAALGLGHYRDRDAVPALVAALVTAAGQDDLAVDLLASLGAIGEATAEEAVVAALHDRAEAVRLAAIEALGPIGGTAAVAALEPIAATLLGGSERTAARTSLEAIRVRHGAGALSLTETTDGGGELSVAPVGGEVAVVTADGDG